MIDYSVTPLFPVPLYRTPLGSLEKNIRELIETLEFEEMPSKNGHYTVNKYILDQEKFTPLKNRIQYHVNNFLYEVLGCDKNLEFQIQNSWINRHSLNDWADSHRHNNSLISGVYYIDVNDDSGTITFLKDKSHYNLWPEMIDVEIDQTKLNFFNAQTWDVLPKKNDLIMFPSLLYHAVSENKSNKLRYSLAFNVFPRGTLGGSINTLKI
jgi:uncharacterized protein (TIGR02466 family)